MNDAVEAIKGALQAYVRSLFARIDYLAGHWARAVAQNGDGTLELQADDRRFPGLSNVPIRYGVPGVSAKVTPGARILLEFEGGDPSKPFATVWESASVLELQVTANTIVLNGGVLPVARVTDRAGPWPIVGGNPTILG